MKDLLGALTSALCICHCLLTPILIGFGVTGLLADSLTAEWLHLALLGPILLLLLTSLPSAHCRHGNALPLSLAITGISLLVTSLFIHGKIELLLSLSGGLLMIAAHLLNRHLLHKHINKGVTTGLLSE